MKRIQARTLLKFSTDQLWELLTGTFIVVFDDGEVVTNDRETQYSSYAWDFHRKYPETPMLVKHHVNYVLNDRRLGSDTHMDLLANVMWSVYDQYVMLNQSNPSFSETILRDELAKMIYETTNTMYCDLTYRCEEYVVSLDITDFMHALNHPTIKAANENTEPNQKSIEKTYGIISDTLMNGVDLPDNPIALACRSKIVSMGQVRQCLGPRGVLTDIDSHTFRNPVMRGYAQGIRTMHDSLIESRSAAKSLIFSKTPLQQSEYFSRRLQLVSQIVQNLHTGDCGSTTYLYWNVRKTETIDGVTREGDLRHLDGKYYMDDDGQLKLIKQSNNFLIGRTLKLRSIIHCAHPDPFGVCSTCFGELSLSVPADTNIGQFCSSTLAGESSQNVMSVKHLDNSSAVEGIVIQPQDRPFLKVAPDENSYLLADELKGKEVKLVIKNDDAANITDIMDVKQIEDLNITRVSEISNIMLKVTHNNVMTPVGIEVNLGRRLASMTYPFLHYIRNGGWEIDEKGNYVFDMKDWDWSKPILTLPLQHINMSDHSRDIANLLESSVAEIERRDTVVSPDNFIAVFFDKVNEKLNVNLAVLEVVVYSAMIVSAQQGDYSLPKPWTTSGLSVLKPSMENRSLSTTMAYQYQSDAITNPDSYIYTNRTDTPMDALILPERVLT